MVMEAQLMTNNDVLADRARMIANHGQKVKISPRGDRL